MKRTQPVSVQEGDKLTRKAAKIAGDLHAKGKIDKKYLGAITKLQQGEEIVSINTLNHYVHSPTFSVSPGYRPPARRGASGRRCIGEGYNKDGGRQRLLCARHKQKRSAIGAPLNQSGYWFLPIGRHGPIVIAAGLIVPIISGVSLGFRIARCIFELILAHIEAISAKLRVVIELVPWQTM